MLHCDLNRTCLLKVGVFCWFVLIKVESQKTIPQSMALWHAEYFELRDIGRPLQKQPQNQGLSPLPASKP